MLELVLLLQLMTPVPPADDAAAADRDVHPSRVLRAPRRPDLPGGSKDENPIDRLLRKYFTNHGVTPPPVVGDLAFARRVYFDVIGIPPSSAELQSFLDDDSPDKRARLVRTLLADDARYTDHWVTFWSDALRNDDRGTGYIDGGRRSISRWLDGALLTNKPYDAMVRDLIVGAGGADGFIRGIVWRGTVNASQIPAMQASQNVAQVFLGVNLKCASCHDSFIDDWKLEDAYGLAAVFSDEPLVLHHCNEPKGRTAIPRFLWPQLGDIDAAASRSERREQLAELVVGEANGRFPRTMVNRLWAIFFGRGLVEPVDEMAGEAWHVDLLDWLASELVTGGYDLRRLMELMLTSRAYQLPAVTGTGDDLVFRGPEVRRLSAEQLVDAVMLLTRSIPDAASAEFLRAIEDSGAEPLFRSGVIASGARDVEVDITGARSLWLVVTNAGNNNHHDWANWGEPRLVTGDGELELTELEWRTATTGYGKIRIHQNIVGKPMRLDGKPIARGIGTHASSVIVYDLPPGTVRFRAQVGPDQQAVDEGGARGHDMEFLVYRDLQPRPVRVSRTKPGALLRALGRPNREQVVTRRESETTTLQALEMTNGATLATLIGHGAREWLAEAGGTADGTVTALYRAALGRGPDAQEREIALELVGDPVTVAGVEDLLWAIIMLPEFQLIY